MILIQLSICKLEPQAEGFGTLVLVNARLVRSTYRQNLSPLSDAPPFDRRKEKKILLCAGKFWRVPASSKNPLLYKAVSLSSL